MGRGPGNSRSDSDDSESEDSPIVLSADMEL